MPTNRAQARLPSLEDLRCYEAAARWLSFRRAAKEVALTPAAFGQRIRRLEEQLGSVLFERTTRSVELTKAGQAMLAVTRRCLLHAGECARAVRGELPPELEITLGTRFELGMSWIVPKLDLIREAHPNIDLHLYFGPGTDLIARLGTRDIDCAVTSSRFDGPTLEGEALHREDYVFVASPGLLKSIPFARTTDAKRHILLDINNGLLLFRYLRDAPNGPGPLSFRGYRWLGASAAIRDQVLRGNGVAVLPEYLVRSDLKRGALSRILPRTELEHDHFRLVFRSGDTRRATFSALAGTFRKFPIC